MIVMNEIINYLDEIIPNPTCELDFETDYQLLIAVMLSAQTTDKRVNMVTSKLFKKYPSVYALKEANMEDIINIIKSLGSYNKKANNVIEISKRLFIDYNGIVPNERSYLESLPGVGRKTTNVVLNILFNEQCVAVDTHVARVSVRLNLANPKDDVLTIEKKLTKKFSNYDLGRIHHQILLFGRYYCKAKKPECLNCKLKLKCREYKKSNL